MDREKIIKGLEVCFDSSKECNGCPYITTPYCRTTLRNDVIALLKEQREIKEQFIEAFNTIRDAYNAPANREKILLNYLARNACCCEQKLLIDSDQNGRL